MILLTSFLRSSIYFPERICLNAEENYNPKSDKGQCGLTAFAPDREWKKVVDIFGGKMYNNNREYIGELGSKL